MQFTRLFLVSPVSQPSLFGLQECRTLLFEPTDGDGTEDKPSDVRQVRHATGLHMRHRARVHQLS